MLPLGLASGLPLALSGATLQAWMTVAGVDLQTIGLLGLAGLPYTYKFLWAGALDEVRPLGIDRRRAWVMVSQWALSLCILALAHCDPGQQAGLIGLLALLIATLSATQDMAFDAYRTEVLAARERGAGVAVAVFGYRLGMLLSGAIALIVADHFGWKTVWLSLAAMLAGLSVVAWLAPSVGEAPAPPSDPSEGLLQRLITGIRPLFLSRSALGLLSILVLYKLGDAWVASLSSAFLIRGAGYSLTDVGVINKGVGLLATLLGALCAGQAFSRWGLYPGLWWSAWAQAITNVGFLALALWPSPGLWALGVVVILENFAGGLGTVALLSLMMSLTRPPHTALQFALLSALTALPRVWLAPVVGQAANLAGWSGFFALGLLAAVPGLLLLRVWRSRIEALTPAA